MKRAMFAILFALIGCAPLAGNEISSVSERAIPICSIIADAPRYDGQIVVVRASFQSQPHGSILFGKSCLNSTVAMRDGSDYKENPRAASMLATLLKEDDSKIVNVIFRGIFRVARPGQCFNSHCAQYQIEASEFIDANPQ
jgi:hypothetical protein